MRARRNHLLKLYAEALQGVFQPSHRRIAAGVKTLARVCGVACVLDAYSVHTHLVRANTVAVHLPV